MTTLPRARIRAAVLALAPLTMSACFSSGGEVRHPDDWRPRSGPDEGGAVEAIRTVEPLPPPPVEPAEPPATAILDPAEPMPRAEGAFAWPVAGPAVDKRGAGGISLRAAGDVAAVKSGVVARTLAHWQGLRNLVIVKHGDGFYSLYADADEILAPVGRAVRQGEAVARFRSAGMLRFLLYRGTQAVDPLAHLR